MKILQNRMIAVILCAVMILGASFAGAAGSLRALRAQSETVFELGVQRDLGEIAAQCYNITQIARNYLPEDDPGVAVVLQKREALIYAVTPGEKHRVAGELVGAANALRHTLERQALSGQDLTLLQKCVVNIDSGLAIIANDPYNEAAADFNRALGGFPANFLGPLTGVTPLELYQ